MSDMMPDRYMTYACFNDEHDLCEHEFENEDGCRCRCHKKKEG